MLRLLSSCHNMPNTKVLVVKRISSSLTIGRARVRSIVSWQEDLVNTEVEYSVLGVNSKL